MKSSIRVSDKQKLSIIFQACLKFDLQQVHAPQWVHDVIHGDVKALPSYATWQSYSILGELFDPYAIAELLGYEEPMDLLVGAELAARQRGWTGSAALLLLSIAYQDRKIRWNEGYIPEEDTELLDHLARAFRYAISVEKRQEQDS